jgi:predicted ribosome quality control (RQC) complex YloA/Tae2 family protein
MNTGDFIAFGFDIAVLFTKFYKLGKVSVMLESADASVEGMKAYNEAMKTEQKDAEEALLNIQKYWSKQRTQTWLEIYLFTILAFGCLIGGIYA